MSSTSRATISFIRIVRANSARCSASPTTGKPTSRIWRRRPGPRKAARTSFRTSRTAGGIALAPAVLAGVEWVGVIETTPNAVIMAPAASIRNTSLLVGAIAVLCAAVLALLIARSLTRPIVQLTEAVQGVASNRQGRHSGRCTRRDRRARARVCASDRGSECKDRRAPARGSGASPHRSGARPSCRAGAAVQRGGRILQRRHHHDVARRHHHRLELGGGAAVRIQRGGSRGQEHHAACTRRPAAGAAGRAAPDRLGRKHRAQRNGAPAKRTASRIEVSLSISPIKSPSGATIGISKVARDITEANKTRQVLRQQTEELRRIFETSQDLIMVMDARGFLVQISPSCEAILGYRPEEMIGRSGGRLHSSRPSRDLPPGNARGTARAAPEDFRHALHSQERAGGVAVMARNMVRAGQALLLRRPRHDREPAGAGDACAKANSSRAASSTPRSTPSSRSTRRAVIRDWNAQAENIFGWPRDEALGTKCVRSDGPAGRASDLSRKPCKPSCFPATRWSVSPAVNSRSGGGTEGDHGRTEHRRAEDARWLRVQRIRPRSHRQDRGRGQDPAGREDGGGRPAHRRHRARFQQYPDRDHGNDRNPGRRGQGRTAACRHHANDRRGRVARRRPHPAFARFRAQAAARTEG